MRSEVILTVVFTVLSCFIGVECNDRFNQTAGYNIDVDFDTWSNFGQTGGCQTCRYTCARPTVSPDGGFLNYSNATQISSLPDAYTSVKMNGCCYAQQATEQPSCSAEAQPAGTEDCGYLYGPSLAWDIQSTNPPDEALHAIMFASIDCTNFWAIGSTLVKQDRESSNTRIKGIKQINGGCYGDPMGGPIVLSACLTTSLKFDKSASYSWDKLAMKCMGLSGKCSRTNGLWGRNLKCCSDAFSIDSSNWDLLNYPEYNKPLSSKTKLSGLAVTAIVFGGVALLLCMVHYGKKLHQRAQQTALMREQEATDDYEEVTTPLTGIQLPGAARGNPRPHEASLEVSLHEGDQIFNSRDPEVLYEGDMK